MWDAKKSVKLSWVCTRIVMVGIVACAVCLPRLMVLYCEYATWAHEDSVRIFTVLLYTCCVPAMLALFCLDRLLLNIKKEEIFIDKNVSYLRRISWCCFAVAFVLLVAGYYYLLFVAAGIAAGFIGLILRVVKNVIQQAILIKAENDYTI